MHSAIVGKNNVDDDKDDSSGSSILNECGSSSSTNGDNIFSAKIVDTSKDKVRYRFKNLISSGMLS